MDLEWGKDKKRALSIEEFKDECIIFLSKYEEFIFKGASLLERINHIDVNDNYIDKIYRSTKDIDITNIGKSKKELKEITLNPLLTMNTDKLLEKAVENAANRVVEKEIMAQI